MATTGEGEASGGSVATAGGGDDGGAAAVLPHKKKAKRGARAGHKTKTRETSDQRSAAKRAGN